MCHSGCLSVIHYWLDIITLCTGFSKATEVKDVGDYSVGFTERKGGAFGLEEGRSAPSPVLDFRQLC